MGSKNQRLTDFIFASNLQKKMHEAVITNGIDI